jgi:hypothetical protein
MPKVVAAIEALRLQKASSMRVRRQGVTIRFARSSATLGLPISRTKEKPDEILTLLPASGRHIPSDFANFYSSKTKWRTDIPNSLQLHG